MRRSENSDIIYLEHWLAFHPYTRAGNSDYYYLKLCNEIYPILKEDVDVSGFMLSPAETKRLACFLICYFEDVISGRGLWRVFTGRVKELYGTWLPFYEPVNGRYFTDEYFPEEINYADVSFLLWYYFSSARKDDECISPVHMIDSGLPGRVFEIMEREYEIAPENLQLKQFYSLDADQISFSDLNEKLRWIVLDSWLLFFSGLEAQQVVEEQMERTGEVSIPEDVREGYAYDFADSFALALCSPLTAMRGNEWLARILGSGHPLYGELMDMGVKKTGHYLYTGRQGRFMLFRHLHSGKELNVNALSIDPPIDTVPGITVVFAGFTEWLGSWWFSGSLINFSDDTDLAGKIQNTDYGTTVFREEPEWKSGDLDGQGRAFGEYNGGKSMAFVANRNEAIKFIRDFHLFYNRTLRLKGRKKRERIKEILTYFQNALKAPAETFESDELMPVVVYFNPDYGIEATSDCNDMIPDPDNPWYDPGSEDDEPMLLLESVTISGRWSHHIMEEYDLPGLTFPGERGKEILEENLDFMLRFWKGRYYYPENIGSD